MKPLSCHSFVTIKGGQEQFPGTRATVFLRSDDAATRCMFLCGYYSRAAFISWFLLGTGRMPHPVGGAMGVTLCHDDM